MAVSKIGTNALSSGLDVSSTNISYTGTLTGGTGVVNIGSGQVYKDASGNVGIGATSIPSGYKLLVGSSSTNAGIELFKSGSGAQGGYLNLRPSLAAGNEYNLSISAYDHSGDNNTDGISINAFDGISFCTGSNTRQERARITSSGYSKFSNDGTYIGASSSYHEFRNTANASTLILSATSASLADDLFAIYASRNTTNNTFYAINYYNSGAGAYRFRVADSGNVTNTNNSYGAISDAKLKENVTDATPKLEKLTQVRVVNYNLIGETQKQLGVIAQELEPIFPGMVEETPDRDEEGNDLGTTTKSVKYSVFVPMLIKAIQELKAELDSVKAELAVLKGVA